MVVRHSWRGKQLVDLQSKLYAHGFTVQPKMEGYVDKNGKIITQTTELTAYSDNYTWVSGYKKGEISPREIKENVRTTPKDERLLQLFFREYRHTLSVRDVAAFILLGGVVAGGLGLFFELYLYSLQFQHP